jgi:aryl-alcohol dehydrogenase-like predicted oxidoreductase
VTDLSLRLGFGTSALVGGRTRKEALDLLACAYDSGIRHFDTARLYGSGDAEALLGEFLAGRDREAIVVATKFGLRSRPRPAAAKSFARAAMRRSKRLTRVVRRHSGGAVVRGEFSPSAMEASLAESLHALRLESVDLFMLHDCSPSDWQDAALAESLASVVDRGLARSVGVATGFAPTWEIFAAGGRLPAVAQFDDDPGSGHAERLREAAPAAQLITHGAFRALADLDRRGATSWSEELGVDLGDDSVLSSLCLAALLESNRDGVVLFSTGSTARIAANVETARTAAFSPEQLARFGALLRDA